MIFRSVDFSLLMQFCALIGCWWSCKEALHVLSLSALKASVICAYGGLPYRGRGGGSVIHTASTTLDFILLDFLWHAFSRCMVNLYTTEKNMQSIKPQCLNYASFLPFHKEKSYRRNYVLLTQLHVWYICVTLTMHAYSIWQLWPSVTWPNQIEQSELYTSGA